MERLAYFGLALLATVPVWLSAVAQVLALMMGVD